MVVNHSILLGLCLDIIPEGEWFSFSLGRNSFSSVQSSFSRESIGILYLFFFMLYKHKACISKSHTIIQIIKSMFYKRIACSSEIVYLI